MTDEVKCPICGSGTRLRTSKKDERKFYVCVKYPRCKGKVAFDENWGDDWDEERPSTKTIHDRPQHQIKITTEPTLSQFKNKPKALRPNCEGDKMEVVSVCPKCEYKNKHEVDHNGEAKISCSSCAKSYKVKTYEVRAKGGRRDRSSGIKHYSIRVKEPDRDETMLEFDSKEEIEMRSGDWITGSYYEGKLKYLLNHKIHQYWDVQKGMGCCVLLVIPFIVIIIVVVTCVVI